MLNEILQLREAQKEKEGLMMREKELKTPVLSDLSFIPTLYGWFLEILNDIPLPPNPDSVLQRKKFLFAVVLLYSPATFCGDLTKAGLCTELAKLFHLSRGSVLRDISSMLLYYENYRDYAEGAEWIYREFVRRLEAASV
jgi:hypothetical protein